MSGGRWGRLLRWVAEQDAQENWDITYGSPADGGMSIAQYLIAKETGRPDLYGRFWCRVPGCTFHGTEDEVAGHSHPEEES